MHHLVNWALLLLLLAFHLHYFYFVFTFLVVISLVYKVDVCLPQRLPT